MKHINFLSNPVAENEVNRALATEKTLQNAGGGTSQSSALRSEGTRHKALIIAKQFSQYCVSRSKGAHTSEQFSRYCASRSEGAQIKKEQAWYEKEQAERGATLRGCRFNNLGITYVSPRYSLGLTTAWKYVACILMLLVLSVGQMWGDVTYTVNQPTVGKHTSGPIVIYGEKGSGKVDNQAKSFSNKDNPIIILSTAKNIKSISFDAASSSSGTSGTTACANVKVMSGNSFETPSNGTFTATTDGSSLASVSSIPITKVQTSHTTIVVDFSPSVSAVSITGVSTSSGGYAAIGKVVVTYDEEISAPSLYSEGHFTSASEGVATNSCSWSTVSMEGTTAVLSSKSYYKTGNKESNCATFALASGDKLAEGDVIILDICGAASSSGAAPGSKSMSATLINGPTWAFKGEASTTYDLPYVIPSGSSLINASSFSVKLDNNDTRMYGVRVYHTASSPGYKLSVFNSSTNGEYNFVAGTGENEIVINNFVIPEYTAGGDSKQFWVGPGSYTGHAKNEYFSWKRAYHQQNNSCTSNLTLGSPVNAIGTLHAWTNSDQDNYGLCFEPNGYGIVWGAEGSGSPWTNVPFESTGEPTVWLTDIVSLTSDMISNYKYYVGLLTNDGGYVGSFRNEGDARGLSNTENISGIRRKTAAGDNWANGLVAGHGKFRIWVNNCTQNFYCHFVPHYKLTYNANGGDGAPEADYVSVETDPCQLTVSSAEPTRTDYVFQGWNPTKVTADAGTKDDAWDPSDTHAMTGDVTLYAVWQACSGPTISANDRTGIVDGAHEVGDELGTASVTATAGNGGTLSYKWYYYDDSPGKPVDPNDYTAAPGTNNQATYQIPSSSTCTARHYFCVVSEEGCSTTVEGIATGALTLTEPADPCTEPEKLTNEIARFFLPCGTSAAYNVENQESTKDDNTFTTTGFNGDRNTNATTGFIYGKLTGNGDYIQLKLNTGSFRAGDVVNAYFYDNKENDNLKLKNQSSGNELGAASASGYDSEYVRTYTLTAADIEDNGSIKFFRKGSDIRVNRIIVTREPACFEATITKNSGKYTLSTGSGETKDITSDATITSGGTIVIKNNYVGSKDYSFSSNGLSISTTSGYIEFALPSGSILTTGSVIIVTGTSDDESHGLAIIDDAGATVASQKNNGAINLSYTVTAESAINELNHIRVNRATNNTVQVKSVTVIGCEEASCADFTVTRGGQESGTFTVGSYDGSALTCTPSPAGSYTYAWKQYNSAASGTPETAVAAEGTGNNTNSFTPNPASAGTYIYFCDVTDACSTTKRTSLTGAFTFNAAPAFTASTSVNIEQGVLTNSKKWDYQSALTAANITFDLTTCELDSLDDACNKTDRNNDYLGLKIKAGAKYIQMNVPSGKTLKVRFGKRAAAVKVWIDEVAQTDIPTDGNYYTYELASSGSNRVVKIATADGSAVVIKQIMIGEEIASVTLPAKITLGGTTNGTISVASTKVNVGSTVTVTATPASGYELATLTYTPACPAASEPVVIDTGTKQFTMPNGNVTINATFTAAAPATYSITYDCDGASSGCPTDVAAATSLPSPLPSAPTKSGYTFDGWYTNSEKTVDAVAGAALTGNVTLYAKWIEDTGNKVTYNGNENTGGSVPTDDTDYAAGEIVTVKGNTGSLVKTGQTFLGWSTSATASSGIFYPAGYKFVMPSSNVTLYAVWGSAAEEKYYYGQVGITDGALAKGAANTLMFFTNEGGVIASSTALTMTTSNLGTGPSCYYNSNDLTHTGLNKSSNWGTSSGANKYIRGLKWANGKSYTLGLGTKVATSIMFYGWAGAADKTLTIGGVEYTSTGTSFFSNDFTKVGDFTDNVTIACGGDFYGILVITISTGAASNFTVSFNMNGHGSAIDAIANVPSGSKIGKPIPDPAAVDWEFGGWYNEAGCTSAFDFANTTITAEKTLYAKWTNCAPTITTQPVGNTYTRGATADPMTIVASGDVTGYQWFSNDENNATTGTPIDGQTTGGYRPTTGVVGTTYYYCVVSNDCGSVASNVVAIVVNDNLLTPRAVWTVDAPTQGGQGFTFSVAAKKSDGSEAWDGTLTEGMLTVSEGVILGAITVDNDDKIISGTYGVSGTAESPVTFYLSLPRTDTHSAALLSHTEDFTACAGGAGEVEIPVLSGTTDGGSVKNSPRYWWETAGNGRLFALSYGKSDCASTSDDNFSSDGFNYVTSANTQRWVFQPYIEGVTKIRIYIKSATNGLTLSSIGGSNNWADQSSKYSSVTTSSITYGTANATNFSNNEKGYIEITFGSALTANKYYMFAMSSSSTYIYGVKLYSTAATDAGTIIPTLGWSPSIDGNVERNENAADFSITATRSNDEAIASLGTISYSSSNTAVATVNATTGQVTIAGNIDFGSADYIDVTITATLSASGCYKKATNTYTLRVKKYVCTEAAGTVTVTSESGCGKVLTISGYEEGASIQWYKDGEAITGAIETSYTATSGGTYYAITHKGCYAVSNELTISTAAATAKKIVDEWYVKKGRRTPDIALVQTTNATGFTVSVSGSPIWNSDETVTTGFADCGFYLGEDGIIYLKGETNNGKEPAKDDGSWAAGDVTLSITATACANAAPVEITIHKQASTDNPSIAFVVDGGVGKAVNNVSDTKTSSRALWTYLTEAFTLTGCNIYWTTDEKALRQYYSQYDAILITDDPNTRQYPGGKDEKISATKGYVNAMGTLIDVRPMLTMEAYVSRLANWDCVKGTPYSPSPRDYVLKLQCKEHAIYKNLVENGTTVLHKEIDGIDHWYVTMVDASNKTYADTDDETDATGTPALQGFDGKVNAGMLGIGTIADETLQGGIERQAEPAARMMVLGINNKAMAALTEPGKKVIMNALTYLLHTDMETLEDCSNYFHGQEGTNTNWFTAANWSAGKVPDPTVRAIILAPCEIAGATPARASSVDIAVGGKTGRYKSGASDCDGHLTIAATGALVVSEGVRRIEDAPNFGVDNRKPTQTSDLYIASTSENGNGTLIFDNPDGNTQATVGYYSKATTDENTTWNWQYMAVPFNDNSSAYRNYYDSYLYRWAENCSGWEVVPNRGAVYPWVGYTITQVGAKMYYMDGTLVETGEQTFTVPTGADLVLGNSWTAPLQIKQFEDDDFDGLQKKVYLFNTGYDYDKNGTQYDDGSHRYEAGTYVVIPIHSSSYTGDSLISSLQAFTVTSDGGEGTLTLDYERHVRPARSTDKVNAGQMHAPRRAAAREDKPTVLKIWASGNRFDDRLVVLEREDFSTGSDDGWDGEKVLMGEMSPTVYTVMENGYESVTATNDYEGTLIGFKAGEDNEYTFHFEYDDMAEPLFLLDMDERMYVRILTGTTYTFTCADKGEHNRFLLTRKAPGIATGCEPIDGGGGPKAMKFIKDNKLYILLNGVLYDATGKIVVR